MWDGKLDYIFIFPDMLDDEDDPLNIKDLDVNILEYKGSSLDDTLLNLETLVNQFMIVGEHGKTWAFGQ